MPYDNDISTLTYISHVSQGILLDDIVDILEKSVKNNKILNITGILLFNNKRFFQLLEGDKRDIEKIYDRIALDARHYNINVLNKSTNNSRLLQNWSMAFLTDQNELMNSSSKLNVYEKNNLEDFLLNMEELDSVSRIFLKNIFRL